MCLFFALDRVTTSTLGFKGRRTLRRARSGNGGLSGPPDRSRAVTIAPQLKSLENPHISDEARGTGLRILLRFVTPADDCLRRAVLHLEHFFASVPDLELALLGLRGGSITQRVLLESILANRTSDPEQSRWLSGLQATSARAHKVLCSECRLSGNYDVAPRHPPNGAHLQQHSDPSDERRHAP